MKKTLLISLLIIFQLHINALDGSIDTSFEPNIILNSTVNTSAIQDDGKVILGGHFEDINSSGKKRMEVRKTLTERKTFTHRLTTLEGSYFFEREDGKEVLVLDSKGRPKLDGTKAMNFYKTQKSKLK